MNTSKSVSKQRTLTIFRMNTYEKQREGRPVIVNQISAEEICPACPDLVGALIPILCPDFQLSTVNFRPSHLLGLRRRVRGRLSRPLKMRRSKVDSRKRSEEHTSELQSPDHLVCRLLLEKKKKNNTQ